MPKKTKSRSATYKVNNLLDVLLLQAHSTAHFKGKTIEAEKNWGGGVYGGNHC